jgi:hypothetical protein
MNLNESQRVIYMRILRLCLNIYITAQSNASDHFTDEREVWFLDSDYTEI